MSYSWMSLLICFKHIHPLFPLQYILYNFFCITDFLVLITVRKEESEVPLFKEVCIVFFFFCTWEHLQVNKNSGRLNKGFVAWSYTNSTSMANWMGKPHPVYVQTDTVIQYYVTHTSEAANSYWETSPTYAAQLHNYCFGWRCISLTFTLFPAK